jgi:hypothetical protein
MKVSIRLKHLKVFPKTLVGVAMALSFSVPAFADNQETLLKTYSGTGSYEFSGEGSHVDSGKCSILEIRSHNNKIFGLLKCENSATAVISPWKNEIPFQTEDRGQDGYHSIVDVSFAPNGQLKIQKKIWDEGTRGVFLFVTDNAF